MKKIYIKDDTIPNIDLNVACIGYFDGVHKGHQALINFTKYLANTNNLKSMVICFDPDPIDIINPKNNNKHLQSIKERLNHFEALGIDIVCVIKFSEDLMKLSAKDFIDNYLSKMNIETIVCGYDFTFGYLGKGNVDTLSKYLSTVVIDEVSYNGEKISSTRIKDAVRKGDFKLANKLLGYDYTIRVKIKFTIQYELESICWAFCVDDNQIVPQDDQYGNFTTLSGNFFIKNLLDISEGDEILISFTNE